MGAALWRPGHIPSVPLPFSSRPSLAKRKTGRHHARHQRAGPEGEGPVPGPRTKFWTLASQFSCVWRRAILLFPTSAALRHKRSWARFRITPSSLRLDRIRLAIPRNIFADILRMIAELRSVLARPHRSLPRIDAASESQVTQTTQPSSGRTLSDRPPAMGPASILVYCRPEALGFGGPVPVVASDGVKPAYVSWIKILCIGKFDDRASAFMPASPLKEETSS